MLFSAQSADYICGVKVATSASNNLPKDERYFIGIPGIEGFGNGFDILTGFSKTSF